ncbi:MAG: metallophosphoesterase family protein [Pyrinomonadaceae bacterium]
MRIFAISDLHTDFEVNYRLLDRLSTSDYKNDVLVVAGDISHRMNVIKDTLSLLCSIFSKIVYVPGNHELWVRADEVDSIEKLHRVIELCEALGVDTKPSRAGDLWIVPLFSWYDTAFDTDGDDDTAELTGWVDYYLCKWPMGIDSVSQFFMEMNRPNIKRYDAPVLSLSHFLPRRDLLPSTSQLRFKGLPKVAGSSVLEEQIRKLQSSVHVFGHSHIDCDKVIDGIRYVQNALKYPKERQKEQKTQADLSVPLKIVWNSGNHL